MSSIRQWLKRLIREAVRDELVRAGQTTFDEMGYKPPMRDFLALDRNGREYRQ